jgi:hypothetical protein
MISSANIKIKHGPNGRNGHDIGGGGGGLMQSIPWGDAPKYSALILASFALPSQMWIFAPVRNGNGG